MPKARPLSTIKGPDRDLLNADGLRQAVNNITNDNFAEPLNVSNGGTGAATLTGAVLGNGTSAMTAGALPVAYGGTGNTVGASYQTKIDIVPFFASAASGSWVFGADSASLMAGWVQAGATQNEYIEYPVYLISGTYSFYLLHCKDTNRGIYTFALDGSSIGTIDGYNGSTSRNQTGSITGVSVASSGLKTLRVTMATKNASSSAYQATIQLITIIKTA